MEKLKGIILKKQPEVTGVTFIFIILVYLIKWRLSLNFEGFWFIIGSLTGLYIVDIAEELFNLNPSPFRSVLFYVSFMIVSFFVVTSSGNLLVCGMVLSMYITLISYLVSERKKVGNIQAFLTGLNLEIPQNKQNALVTLFIIFFFLEVLFLFRLF